MRPKSLAVAALFMALVMVTTAFVKIPRPLTGYIHLGDTFIFLACFFLKKPYAIAASAMGSALADVIAFPVYAPATLIIKAVMALIFCLIAGEEPTFWRCVLGAVAASVWMLAGYYVFNSVFLVGWSAALLNLALDSIQPLCCSILGILAIQTCRRVPFLMSKRIR